MHAPPVRAPAPSRAVRPLAPSLERSRLRAYLLMMAGDIVCLLAGFFLAGGLYHGIWPDEIAMVQAQLLLPVFLTIALYQGAYSIKALSDPEHAVMRLLLALSVAAALLIFITFYAKSTAFFSRVTFTMGLCFSAMAMIGLRVGIVRWMRARWGPSVLNTMLIMDGGPEVVLRDSLAIDAREHELDPDTSDPASMDRLGRYLMNMDRVVISCPVDRRMAWTEILRAAGVRGEVVSGVLQELRPVGLQNRDGLITLVVSTGPLGIRARVFKRLFDLAVASAGLVLLGPLMLLTALAIKLEDGGPALFRQQRLGQGNRFFNVLKFRSMRVESEDENGSVSASREDGRTTRVGRFIRRTSLDELPQLLNVLKNEMSIVGPRPHAVGSQAGDKLFWEVDGKYWQRHALKPGLTGLAQIRGWRGATDKESDLQGRLLADLEYMENWHPLADLAIVARTLGVLVHDRAF